MPPGIVSIMCLRSVGWFSRTKEIPAAAATSRNRMGGTGAAASAAQMHRPADTAIGNNPRVGIRLPSARRADLSLARHCFLLLLDLLEDLLVFCHGSGGLLPLAGRLVRAAELVVQAAVFQFQG